MSAGETAFERGYIEGKRRAVINMFTALSSELYGGEAPDPIKRVLAVMPGAEVLA